METALVVLAILFACSFMINIFLVALADDLTETNEKLRADELVRDDE